jgi:hypothetical protein
MNAKNLVQVAANLVQAAAVLEAEGWEITWNEEEGNFKAVNRFLTGPVLVVSVFKDKLFKDKLLIEEE